MVTIIIPLNRRLSIHISQNLNFSADFVNNKHKFTRFFHEIHRFFC